MERKITYRDLPPDLQAVWREVYAAVLSGASGANTANALEIAWKAVEHANGGEMPKSATQPDGVESARIKLERAVVTEAQRGLVRLPFHLQRAVANLNAFEAEHGRRA